MALATHKNVKLTDAPLEVLESLISETGRPLWAIAEELGCDKGNLSRTIKGLENRGMVYHEEGKSSRWGTRSPNMPEHRYFILKNRYNLRMIDGAALQRIEHHKRMIYKDDNRLGTFTKDGVNRNRQILINRFGILLNWVATIEEENQGTKRKPLATIDQRPRTHQDMMAIIWGYALKKTR